MQKSEFKHLMNLGDALEVSRFPRIANLQDMSEGEIKGLHTLPENEARNIIEKHEKPMPEKLAIKVKQYIDRRRKAGVKEKTIRKAVMKKFGITVV